LRESYHQTVSNGSIWESLVNFTNSNNESLAEPFLISPELIKNQLFAPTGGRRECCAGKKCHGMQDFPDESKVVLMEYLPEQLEQEFQLSGKHSTKPSFCVLCIIFQTCAIINKAKSQMTDITKTPSPYYVKVNVPGGYTTNALYQNTKSQTNGNCWYDVVLVQSFLSLVLWDKYIISYVLYLL
jgi:hypothetical protein